MCISAYKLLFMLVEKISWRRAVKFNFKETKFILSKGLNKHHGNNVATKYGISACILLVAIGKKYVDFWTITLVRNLHVLKKSFQKQQ